MRAEQNLRVRHVLCCRIILAAVLLFGAMQPATACIFSGDPEIDRCNCLDPCAFSCHKVPFIESLISRVLFYLAGPTAPFILSALTFISFYLAISKQMGLKNRLKSSLMIWFSCVVMLVGSDYLILSLSPHIIPEAWVTLSIPPTDLLLFVLLLWLWRKKMMWWKAALFSILAVSAILVPVMMIVMGIPSMMRHCFWAV